MARGTQLQQLVVMLKAEAGHAASTAVGVDALPILKQLLARTQRTLLLKHDWPFLRMIPSITLNVGQRYYDVPTDFDLESIDYAAVYYNQQPCRVLRGISFDDYAAYDSDEDERSSPVQKYDYRWTGSSTQLEVWPIPDQSGMTLKLVGQRKLRALVADDDVADLDDDLLVLYAAAEILAKQKSADAQAKMSAAQDHFQRLKSRGKGDQPMTVMGGSSSHNPTRRGPTIVVAR